MSVWSRWTNNPTQNWDRTAGPKHGLLCREAAGQVFPALRLRPFVNSAENDQFRHSSHSKLTCSNGISVVLGSLTGGSGSLFESCKKWLSLCLFKPARRSADATERNMLVVGRWNKNHPFIKKKKRISRNKRSHHTITKMTSKWRLAQQQSRVRRIIKLFLGHGRPWIFTAKCLLLRRGELYSFKV